MDKHFPRSLTRWYLHFRIASILSLGTFNENVIKLKLNINNRLNYSSLKLLPILRDGKYNRRCLYLGHESLPSLHLTLRDVSVTSIDQSDHSNPLIWPIAGRDYGKELTAANVATAVKIRHDKNIINPDQDLIESSVLHPTRGKDAARHRQHAPVMREPIRIYPQSEYGKSMDSRTFRECRL